RSSRWHRTHAMPILWNSAVPWNATSRLALRRRRRHRFVSMRAPSTTRAPVVFPATKAATTPSDRAGRSCVVTVRALALTVLTFGAVAGTLHRLSAQVTANVEAGVSDVQYDGFLASAAGSLSPSMRWEHPRGRGFISARATYLQFQSGRHSLDGSINGSWFTPLARHWRGELGAAAGASDYANIASFSHGQAEARLHLIDSDHGGWLGLTIGSTAFKRSSRPAAVVATGLWIFRGDKTMFASIDRSFVGDTAYSDLRASGRDRKSVV